ncbi:carbohydrate ABC transporter permease [Gordoniibacillus kamchatkensis]|uniref:carbohydrate ABC transporter permease n=1 Tax=Gordoniibacillus kamchatkensis TaxID=1590651 RepID=UPI0006981E92|nr:carbohydrate ABC transporter permease [Paenibacillus sp. VKM B-2647]
MRTSRYGAGKLALELLLVIFASLTLYPIFLILINSVKTYPEVMKSLVSMPNEPTLENFSKVWVLMNYPRAFLNSLLVTVSSVIGVLLASSAAAYRLVRSPGKISRFIFYFVLSSLVIPFQIIMVPALKVAKDFHLVNTLHGLVFMYWGFWFLALCSCITAL